jgi:hypothetical protein
MPSPRWRPAWRKTRRERDKVKRACGDASELIADVNRQAGDALLGGWDVREVRRVLDRLGYGWLGREVELRPKRTLEVTGGRAA